MAICVARGGLGKRRLAEADSLGRVVRVVALRRRPLAAPFADHHRRYRSSRSIVLSFAFRLRFRALRVSPRISFSEWDVDSDLHARRASDAALDATEPVSAGDSSSIDLDIARSPRGAPRGVPQRSPRRKKMFFRRDFAGSLGVVISRAPPREGVSSTKAEDVLHVLRDRVALLPGSRDRHNRPVVIFPARENSPSVSIDNIRNVLVYLHNVTADEFKERGFVIIIDMRKGTPWANVKPILKCLQEFFPAQVHVVFIIKPDKFWEKHKASVSSSGKYKFNLQMISVEDLARFIDLNQLTRDLGGTLYYDHDEWMECRLDLENLIWRMTDIMRNFEVYSSEMKNGNMPFDVDSAVRAIEEHKLLRTKVFSISVDELELQARNIQRRIKGTPEGGTPDDGYNSSTSGGLCNSNPDIIASLPHLQALVNSIRTGRHQLCLQWENRRQLLDHCSQLKLFEKDAEEMFSWTRSHSEAISCQFIEIGTSEQDCQKLLADHQDFARVVENNHLNIERIERVANRLREVGNYGHKQIDATQMRVNDEWRRFTEKTTMRTELLVIALSFHQKASQYLRNSMVWLKQVEQDVATLGTIVTQDQLESAVSAHDAFGDEEKQAYAFAIDDGRKVTQLMKSYTAGDPLGQNASYKKIVELINQITRYHKEFHTKWEMHKQRLYARLARNAFEADTQSVFNWLSEHGEPYLRKNTSIGISLVQAKDLLKHHLKFREVAANTHGNAMKLYDAADQLITCGEVDDPKVRAEVTELKQRMARFQEKVELRKNILSQSVLLHTHFGEIVAWYKGLEDRQNMYRVASLSVDECEKRKEDFMKENDGTAQAFGTTMAECDRLIHALQQQSKLIGIDSSPSVEIVEQIREQITQRNAAFAERHPSQRSSLQLALKCANFTMNCESIRNELLNWRRDMATMMTQTLMSDHAEQAGRILPFHEENTKKVRKTVKEILNTANEILQGLSGNEVELVTPDGVPLRAIVQSTTEHLKEVEENVMKLAIASHEQIHQALQVQHALSLKAKLKSEIVYLEDRMRSVTYIIPSNLSEAMAAQSEHDKFRVELESVTKKCNEYRIRLERMISAENADSQRIRDASNEVNADAQGLIGMFQERNKLINAANVCYRALHENVIPLLNTLEKDLTSTKDYCMELTGHSPREKYEKVEEKLMRHNDYRDRFLKGCTYALKSSDLFLRYIQRCSASRAYVDNSYRTISDIKTQIYHRQANIQKAWPERKVKLETCLKATLYEVSYEQRMDEIERQNAAFAEWCRDGQKHRQLKTCAPQMLDDWSEQFAAFSLSATEERTQVAKMLSLADDFLDQIGDDVHASELRKRLAAIRDRFGSFGSRLVEFGDQLAAARRVPKGCDRLKEDLSLNRLSNSRIEETLALAAHDDASVDSKMRKPMLELIKSEKDYIEDLRKCIECYIQSFRAAENSVPSILRGKEKEIFGNIEELYKFHRETFVEELMKYEHSPEDVGYCFIFWVETLNALYTDYCVNKEQNNHLIGLPEAIQFFSSVRLAHKLEHSHELQSMVIKPVQRITKYGLMLKEILKNCKNNVEEIREAHNVVVGVPKRANDIIHLKNFEGVEKLGGLGEFVMQDTFTVCEPKHYFKKGRERQVFLFECCVVFTKKIEANSKIAYVYKNRLMINEIHICEHIEGDSTKFGLRQGSAPSSDQRTDLKASSEANKVLWVRKIRELMQGLMTLNLDTPNLGSVSSRSSRPSTSASSDRFSKDSSDFQERYSLHSAASSNNLDNPVAIGCSPVRLPSAPFFARCKFREDCNEAPEHVRNALVADVDVVALFDGPHPEALAPLSPAPRLRPVPALFEDEKELREGHRAPAVQRAVLSASTPEAPSFGMLQYSKSFRAIRHRTESLYDRARRKFHASFRSGSARRRRSAANIEHFVVIEDFVATQDGQLSLAKGQIVELVDQSAETPDWILVALDSEDGKEPGAQGLVPLLVLTSVADSDAEGPTEP
ncbi:hypothetical protein QR680_009099 [Steinernema hermaphroditum]|uniref:Uncharacterized protein n=1 Tax=Steinernema hermaphroditum TaxID=289476 RepID=A0AA39IJ37_9BILA|nr:hypothetical protein QR680_009099 [Steinernema hermaphroditum]